LAAAAAAAAGSGEPGDGAPTPQQATARAKQLYSTALADWIRSNESFDEYAAWRMHAFIDASDHPLMLQLDAIDGLFEVFHCGSPHSAKQYLYMINQTIFCAA
jgi:hypothetical protein